MSETYNETQTKILRHLSEHPPSVPAGTLKDAIDSVTRNAVDKQIANLRDSGEVEKVGEAEPEREGQWSPNVYALTREGKKAAAQLPDEDTDESEDVSDEILDQVRALREKVMELEETVDTQAKYIDELESAIEDNTEKVEGTARGLTKVRDRVEDNEDAVSKLGDRTSLLKKKLDD